MNMDLSGKIFSNEALGMTICLKPEYHEAEELETGIFYNKRLKVNCMLFLVL